MNSLNHINTTKVKDIIDDNINKIKSELFPTFKKFS